MKYLQYQRLIEREHKTGLKKVMHQLCVEEGLNDTDGAKKLGVAKAVFVYWRDHYRLNSNQLLFDEITNDLKTPQNPSADEVKENMLKNPLAYEEEISIKGLEEIIARKIEYITYQKRETDGLASDVMMLPFYEFSRDLVEHYLNGTLLQELDEETTDKSKQ